MARSKDGLRGVMPGRFPELHTTRCSVSLDVITTGCAISVSLDVRGAERNVIEQNSWLNMTPSVKLIAVGARVSEHTPELSLRVPDWLASWFCPTIGSTIICSGKLDFLTSIF